MSNINFIKAKLKDPCPCKKLKSNGKVRKYKNCCYKNNRNNDKSVPHRGFNESENILIQIAEKSFLTMWSFPNVFYKSGKELTDVLIIFENKIIIISDKKIRLNELNEISWNKWYRNAIDKSIKQAVTAKNRILRGVKIYSDPKCEKKIPIDIPDLNKSEIFLVCVANGATQACKEFHGDTRGSLNISSVIPKPPLPFTVNLITDKDNFVHILDELSLKNVLENLDTITDFIEYLKEKEVFMRGRGVLAGGEEDLLSIYLENFDDENKKHYFGNLSNNNSNFLYIPEGSWEHYVNNPQYLKKVKSDELSYFWDGLIERFTEHSINNTQYISNTDGISGTEESIRMMAKERRFFRRVLSKTFMDLITTHQKYGVRRRFMESPENENSGYAFLSMRKDPEITESEYRKRRMQLLYAMCLVYKYKNTKLKKITGLATETSDCVVGNKYSEDIIYFESEKLSPKEIEDAEYFSKKIGILNSENTKLKRVNDSEYPTQNK